MTDVDDGGAGRLLDVRTGLKLAIGLLVAVVLVYLLGAVIGWGETVAELRRANPWWILLACLSTMGCLAAWTKTWQVVLRATGVSVPYRQLVVTFYAATFANYVTPMGQAGGEPFIAYILARDTGASYEESLASVVTADLLRMLPFFNVGLVGLAYLLLTAGLSEEVEGFATALVAMAVLVPLAVLAIWRYRDRVEPVVTGTLAPLLRRTDRYSVAGLRRRLDRLIASLERISGSTRAVWTAIGFAYVGWILFALPLYFSGLALGLPVSLLLVCFLVPVTVIAGSTPLPGGLAAIEGTLVLLLGTLAAFTAQEALAITTVYRLTSYWFVVVVGGAAALWVLARN